MSPDPLRIGLVIYGSLETLSGGYLYDRQLVSYLRGAGDHVEIISIPWRNYPQHLGDNFSRRLAKKIVDMQLDVLLQDELNHPSLIATNRRLKGDVTFPIITIVHHLRCSESHPAPARALYRRMEKLYVNGVNGFIYNSLTTQESVQVLLREEKPGIVVYPAADHLPLPDPEEVARLITERERQPAPLRLIFIGNLIARKGLDLLIEALSRLPPAGWQLDVVGSLETDPAYVKTIRRLCTQAGVDSNVHLHGHLEQEALIELLRRSHLLAVPSYEGFGIVYLEAMAFGLPVIASTSGAAHELIRDGREGYLIDPDDTTRLADRLQTLIHNSHLLRAMGESARRRFDLHPDWTQSMAGAYRWLHEIL